jgi:broad specificity phosphatase PhoE
MSLRHDAWVASGLFLGTAVWALYDKRKRHGRFEKEATLEDTRRIAWYSQRRVEDRLSFHELEHLSSSDDIMEGPSRGAVGSASSFDETRDLYPTNSNWNHFEGYSCSDDDHDETHEANYPPTSSQNCRVGHDVGENPLNASQIVLTHAQHERRAASVGTSTTSQAALDAFVVTQQQSLFSKLPQLFPPPSLRRAASVPGLAAFSGSSSERLSPTHSKATTHHVRNRTARSKYNASIMPHQIIMVRHGQSIGNVDEKLYATTPDNAMPLTRLGWEQARHAGRKVWELTQGTSVHFIMSPYVRTVETFHGMASAWCDPSEFAHIADPDRRLKAWYGRLLELGLTWNEDPRIREQDFGNYQEPDKIKQAKRDRYRFGAFYYRFPHGESASDVRTHCSMFVLFCNGLWLN